MNLTLVMAQLSAGLLMCRLTDNIMEYFLVHPGGPYFKNKNEGVWTIPKGLIEINEDHLVAAEREFLEETGIKPTPPFYPIGSVKLKSGKIIHAWCFLGAWDAEQGIVCNEFDLEWPPRSGKYIKTPEVDRASWFPYEEASKMINERQIPFLHNARKIFLSRD